jgi:hypothetical protein
MVIPPIPSPPESPEPSSETPASVPLPPTESRVHRDGIEARLAALRAEQEAVPDRPRQAVLQYEVGHLYERRVGNDALAVKEYLSAFNLDVTFRPPLLALTRIFERRRSFRNLGRLYEAEAKAATTPAEKASALLDRAVLLEDHLSEPQLVRGLLEEALEADPTSLSASLALERHLYLLGDKAAAAALVAARTAHVGEPILRSVLLSEAAWTAEAEGNVDGAFALLREAAALPAGRWRVFEHQERIARKHGRPAELVEALEGRAVLAAAAARGEDQGQGSGIFSVKRFADAARGNLESASLWREGARLRAVALGDGAGAAEGYARALAICPNDLLLRQERMLACELAGDLEGAAADAQALVAAGVAGRHAAGLHFRMAELALGKGDRQGAREALAAALAADPNSAAAEAMLEDLVADDGLHAERVQRLEAQALDEAAAPAERAAAAFRAAHLAADELGDSLRARALYGLAASLISEGLPVLREAYGAALRLADSDGALEAGAALLALPLDDDERSALLRDRLELLRGAGGDEAQADALLMAAVGDGAAAGWAPDAARVRAALSGQEGLLASAHEALAARAADDDSASAHLAAAARARVKAGDEEGAARLLRATLERRPGHSYAVALLEEILRSRGEAEEVVALLRQAAAAQHGARAAETSLLLAGAAAEAAGDVPLAARTYEDAADRDPSAVAPLYALAHLAERASDLALLLRAREGLAAREAAAGQAGRASLELGEHYALISGQSELAEAPLRAAIDDPQVGAFAGLSLALLPHLAVDPEARAMAVERLLRAVDGDVLPSLERELGGIALGGRGDVERAERHARTVLSRVPDDRWALYATWRARGGDSGLAIERANALAALAAATSDVAAGPELAHAAIRARLVAEGALAIDDAMREASALADTAPEALATAFALEETTGAGANAEVRARSLGARLAHAGATPHGAIQGALGRAELAWGQVTDAYATLAAAVKADPEDLAAWEALRVAAREAEQWNHVVAACDVLAERTEGELSAQLCEEAAAVLMDRVDDRDDDAVTLLRRALERGGMSRPIAYGRLHDLLAERGDADALQELVQARIDATDDDRELVKLFYEMARIRRSLGDREGAIAALENLLMLEGEHVGGLALMVETTVSLERFAEAVDALRSLAQADVPAAQKRIARFGAADFLETKLHDAEGALAELRAAAEAGLGDAGLYTKMADVAERASNWQALIESLERGAQVTTGAARAAFERRAAVAYRDKIEDRVAACVALRRALEAVPADVAAGDLLAALLDDGARAGLSQQFEEAVRAELDADPTNPVVLRKLRRAAVWRRDVTFERAVLALLAALGEATPDETNTLGSLPSPTAKRPTSALQDAAFARLRARGDGGPIVQVLAMVGEALVELDGLAPGKYSVGRGERVGPKDASPVRDEVQAFARAFGLLPGDFYVGGREPGLVAAIPREGDPPTWVVGSGIGAPLSPSRRFAVGQLSLALRLGVAPLLTHDVKTWPRLFFAAAAASDAPLPGGASIAGLDEATRSLGKELPRRSRKAIPDLVRSLDARLETVEGVCRALRRTLLRAGLLLASDPQPALEAVLGAAVSRDSVRGNDDARELVLFWTSTDALQMRRELGLT